MPLPGQAMIFSAKEKFSIGLDIGTDSVKAVKLKFNHTAVELCDIDLTPGPAVSSDVLARLSRPQGAKSANISLSGPATLIRYITLPQMNYTELRQALKFEAQKHIPFPVTDCLLDGFILKDSLSNNKMLVLLAVVKKELVDQRLKALEAINLKPNLIDIDSLALINCFNFNYPAQEGDKYKVVALVNVGCSVTNVNILEDGTPRLSRDIHIAGAVFTQKLAEIFSIDKAEADRLKIEPDGARRNKAMVAIESILTNLGNEIRISFDFYESQTSVSVGKVFLSGGSCGLGRIKELLAEALGVEVELWDPFRKISVAKNIDQDRFSRVLPQLAVACGLALRQ